MARALVNGTEYAFADIRIKIGATEIVGATAITYNIAQAKENITGTGDTVLGVCGSVRTLPTLDG